MMEILTPIAIIAALILLNGLFVAAEFAIIGAPRTLIERRASEGHAVAQLVRDILHDPRRQDLYIATAQLGITFASLGLGMYGEHTLAVWIAGGLETLHLDGLERWVAAHALATILSVAILTYFHIVVGEMVPKSMALMHAEGTVLWITRPMLWIKRLFYPLVITLNAIGNGVLYLMGIRRQASAGHYHTPEELRFIVTESQEGGLLREESGRLLHDLFEFGALTAGETMVPRVHVTGLPLGATPEEMSRVLYTERHTRYPVYEGDLDHIVGIIHIKDVLRLLRDKRPLAREEVYTTAFLPETTELDNVLAAMRRARTHLVVVMDEHGGTAGLVSIEDLCVEAMGEVEEGPDTQLEIHTDAAGRLRVAGTARLAEVGEALDQVLEHEEVDTVSGLVLALLERPPILGDTVTYDHVRFEVTAIESLGVTECIATPVPLEEPAEEE